MIRREITNGMRAAYRSPRGLIYGRIVSTYRTRDRAWFEPDAGTTYAGGVLTTLDVAFGDLEPTTEQFQPVHL